MIRTLVSHLPVHAITHAGISGKENEDQFAVSSFQLSRDDPTFILLAVLSDGIGGHRAGEVASKIAVDVISHTVSTSDGLHPRDIICSAITQASDTIYKQSQANSDQYGMGGTCALVWITRD